MNIGIDFDGVINTNNAYKMAILEVAIARKLGYGSRKPKALNSKDRYGFTDEDYGTYQKLRHDQINTKQYISDMQMMVGADFAIKTLSELGHQTFLVTVRGCNSNGELDTNMREYVRQTLIRWNLLESGLLIDEKYSFFDPISKQNDKVTQCKNLGITVLVDDSQKNIQKIRDADLSGILFGVDAKNWQDVIKQIRELT